MTAGRLIAMQCMGTIQGHLLQDGSLLAGQMPPKQQKKIQDFISSNQEGLMEK